MDPEIDADQFTALNLTTGFFQRFANDSLFRGFAGFDMSAGLAKDFSTHRFFFNKQISAI
jgi:hypothetical protein